MAPTDNLFWVSLWSVDNEGWWTLSKPSQEREREREMALICSRLGLLKNKPRVITYQMQIDGQKVLASFL